MARRIAVILFNLGGPDRLEAVQPFLFNLFNDPAIIGAPKPIRWALAKFISTRRAPVAREIYRQLGGKSPLLDLTLQQAAALAAALGDLGEVKTFVCMRYWHPQSDAVVRNVMVFNPDEVILLPLYPQYSMTTTGSSLKDWMTTAQALGLRIPTRTIANYPTDAGWIDAVTDVVTATLVTARDAGHSAPRILFSAHGLPQKVIDGGDPYQHQVEETTAAVAAKLDLPADQWLTCYQSRVGPMTWIRPYVDDEIRRAAADKVAVVVVPIAFVSEHSETLVELDIEYRELAEHAGVPAYYRVPAVGIHPAFINGLADLVRAVRDEKPAAILRANGAAPATCDGCQT